MSTLFCLLRHGETLWNREKRIQGRHESPLSETGRAQALSWGPPLTAWNFSCLYSSTLGRAVETADLCNRPLGLNHHTHPLLCEQDWGRWVGLRIRDLRAGNPESLAREEARGWDFRPPGGESRREVLARAKAFLLEAAAAHPGQRLLVVSHSGVLRGLARHLMGCSYTPGTPEYIERGKLCCVRVQDENIELIDPARDLEATL